MNDRRSGPPRRPKNKEVRGREWIEEGDVRKVRDAAAKVGRYGHRDATMVWIAFRHGLRVSELCDMRCDQVNLDGREIYVSRIKGSKSGTHPIQRDEILALRKLDLPRGGYLFVTERGGPLSPSGFTKILARAAREAGLTIKIHPHMLRHACGYALGGKNVPTRLIQEWLGHRNIQNTVRYVDTKPDAFRSAGIWAWKS